MAATDCPTLIFGGASIGDAYKTSGTVKSLFTQLKALGINRIDTAARYPALDPGASERLLGEAGAASEGFIIDTKINPGPGFGPFDGSLSPEAVEESFRLSCERLGKVRGLEVL